jgi:hypothetical protein
MDDVNAVKALEPVLDYSIRVVGSGIEIFGVVIMAGGGPGSSPAGRLPGLPLPARTPAGAGRQRRPKNSSA